MTVEIILHRFLLHNNSYCGMIYIDLICLLREIKMSRLKDYLELFKENGILCECTADENTEIGYVSYNSQDIKENTFFLCKGAHFKEQFLLDALNKGATVYIAEKNIIQMLLV